MESLVDLESILIRSIYNQSKIYFDQTSQAIKFSIPVGDYIFWSVFVLALALKTSESGGTHSTTSSLDHLATSARVY